jgi:hypothetical protein
MLTLNEKVLVLSTVNHKLYIGLVNSPLSRWDWLAPQRRVHSTLVGVGGSQEWLVDSSRRIGVVHHLRVFLV